jgi:hypothetical protein
VTNAEFNSWNKAVADVLRRGVDDDAALTALKDAMKKSPNERMLLLPVIISLAELTRVWRAESAKVKELEQRPAVEYRGIWAAGEVYHKGDLVTRNGSIWHAEIDSRGVAPGEGAAWRLAVIRGRDGRDLRGAA